MNKHDKEKFIIEQYQNDEEMMILIFAQWCVNHNLDAISLYKKAYPEQMENKALVEAIEKTVPKEESEPISIEMVQQVLQLFGNDDLAFEIQELVQTLEK